MVVLAGAHFGSSPGSLLLLTRAARPWQYWTGHSAPLFEKLWASPLAVPATEGLKEAWSKRARR
jgi:hypothetical protein